MTYFEINIMPCVDRELCFLDKVPEGTAMLTQRMAEGRPMGTDYPADAKIYMDEDNPGITLPSLIGNTNGFLIVRREIQEVLAATGVPTECLPFTLFDHKKRVASRDYFIVNPLGTYDCLDLERSDISWSEEVADEIIWVNTPRLDRTKAEHAPDFFRIGRRPRGYVISGRVAAAIQKLQPTNFYVSQLEVAG
jgi:hypothetical protein